MTLRYVHPGGHFWSLSRAERDATILRVASEHRKMLVLSSNEGSAEALAERMTLSGVPVLLASFGGRSDSLDLYASDDRSALVTTAEFLEVHGPVSAPIVLHTRVAKSVRQYRRRLELAVSPAQLSFVLPEDEPIAEQLAEQLGSPAVVDLDSTAALATVLDTVEGDAKVAVSSRRWFPLAR